MPKVLTAEQIEQYHRDGYVSPVRAYTTQEAQAFRARLEQSEREIHAIRDGLSSDVIAAVVRLMSNEELIRIGAKVFNPLPGSNIGARGYMGARVQPNSPTDNVDDIAGRYSMPLRTPSATYCWAQIPCPARRNQWHQSSKRCRISW